MSDVYEPCRFENMELCLLLDSERGEQRVNEENWNVRSPLNPLRHKGLFGKVNEVNNTFLLKSKKYKIYPVQRNNPIFVEFLVHLVHTGLNPLVIKDF